MRTPSSCRIAPADIDDAPVILALQKLVYESEARLYDDWTLPPLTQTIDSLRAEFATSLVLKAVDGDATIVGSVRARESAGTCHVGRLIVSPGQQGRGIGTRLVTEIEARFPAVPRFELFTGNLSAANIRLYERLGYRHYREQVMSPTVTLVFMEKKR